MALTQEVQELIRYSRDRTVALSDAQVLDLTRAWVDAWDELAPDFEDALDSLTAPGVRLTGAQISQDRRVVQALKRAEQALQELQATAESRTVRDLDAATLDAANAHYAALQAQLPAQEYWPQGFQMVKLDPEALSAIVARTAQQIHSDLIPLSQDSIAAMRAELTRGIAAGTNPYPVARRILKRTEGAFNGGLARAARIARTEMLDAHRTASTESNRANLGVMAGQTWIATLDSRTCGSCLAQHGTEWPAEAWGPEDHQNGRCTFVPKTKSWAELGFAGIPDEPHDDVADRDEWWDNLTPASQDKVLGRTRAELLRSGEITWQDLTLRRDNAQWRPSYTMPSLRELQTP